MNDLGLIFLVVSVSIILYYEDNRYTCLAVPQDETLTTAEHFSRLQLSLINLAEVILKATPAAALLNALLRFVEWGTASNKAAPPYPPERIARILELESCVNQPQTYHAVLRYEPHGLTVPEGGDIWIVGYLDDDDSEHIVYLDYDEWTAREHAAMRNLVHQHPDYPALMQDEGDVMDNLKNGTPKPRPTPSIARTLR